MLDSIRSLNKSNWRKPLNPTKFRLFYPPAGAYRKVEHWDNWLKSMLMDKRLTDTDKNVLTALANHYNLKTGDCFPTVQRLAMELGYEAGETGMRAVQRAT